ncbi:glycoside hydrolase family 114 protein [Roridomyces roridus]|uniref:alpha-galactosidase n=1 Tax=Roridomyces roridus TaxID=1738132 RepID=A0AAD7C749_9AGAR|nr:glycoside hydrolase family 114 protein [Roridomyces roridus]
MVAATFLSLLVSTQLALVLSVQAAPTAATFPANGKFDYQIGGSYTAAADVKVVDRDHSESPVAGLFNICYINAFQTQPEEKSFWTSSANKDLLLLTKAGALFEDKDWPGEYFLDTTTDAKRQRIATILNGWIDDCASKGFNAIEPDNLDTFTRSNGLLTADNNLALAKLFTDHAHSLGLLVAQKNTGDELGSTGKSAAGFDFALAEECNEYEECDSYTDVYGANVIEIEYTDADDASANFKAVCKARGSSISVILRDRDVVASSDKAYHYEEC